MKIKLLIILLTFLFILTACTNTPSETTEITTVLEDTGTETAEEIPEPLALVEKLEYEILPFYREKETVSEGRVLIRGNVRSTVTYTSTFYGSKSAINRPYVSYAGSFITRPLNKGDHVLKEQLAATDINGDGLSDLLCFIDGKLTAYLIKATYKKNETYVADQTNNYSLSKAFFADIGDAQLCGAGDFNGDGYADIMFVKDSYTAIYYGGDGGFALTLSRLVTEEGERLCGDADGDGICDIIIVKDGSAIVYKSNGSDFIRSSESVINQMPTDILQILCADMNCDRRADLAFIVKADNRYKIISVFGDGSGVFGSSDGNKNLYSEFTFDKNNYPTNVTVADFTGNGVADIAGAGIKNNKETNVLFYSAGEPAYDYSLFGMKVNGEYRLYSGCRWSDGNIEGDGDHVMLSVSKDGENWLRYTNGPMFYLGRELGEEGWWTDNTLEPEVIYADGMYHMYWQCTYTTPKGRYGDKIGYAYSADGINWTRKTDEPAVVCSNSEIGFNHEEVLYVADDPDGKPFWLYTGHFIDGVFRGYIRIRSSDPQRFDYADAEATAGFAQIGNQLAYLTDNNGEKLFMRITFTDSDNGCTVPTLQFSRDGLNFSGDGKLKLAGVDQDDPRNESLKNVYFLGLATENGTGEIRQNEDGTYTFMYFATTCATSVAPEIFGAEGGYGIATLTVEFK